MQTLNQDIKTGQFHHMYLLYGEEAYLRISFRNKLKEAMVGDDTMNYHYYTGKNIDVLAVKDMAETLPFFADRRLIIIEDSGLFKSAAEDWVNLVEQLSESTCLIFVETEVDKRSRLYKKISSLGYCANFERQTEAQLGRWILGLLGQQQMKITKEALDALLDRTGTDMERIKNETAKLVSYCAGKEGITAQDVEAVCSERLENRVFQMIEAMAAGQESAALSLYYDLLALKEPSMRILYLIARQMNQLLMVRELSASGSSRDQIAAALKLKPFIAGKLTGQARAFSAAQLKQYVELCVEAEESVKTGKLGERLAVELVLVQIARRKAAVNPVR